MRILLDHGVPVPLRRALADHRVSTAYEMGWAEPDNGELLRAAEAVFDLLITTDKNLRYQQNLAATRLAILVLPTASWPKMRHRLTDVAAAVDGLRPGDFRELDLL